MILRLLKVRASVRKRYSVTAVGMARSERFFGPLVLLHNLLLLLRREIVLDVEELADLGHALVLDQAGHLGAGQLQQRLDVQVVGGHNQLEKHLLVQVDEFGVPRVNDCAHIGADKRFVDLGRLMVAHVDAELNHFFKDRFLDVGERNLFFFVLVHDTLD